MPPAASSKASKPEYVVTDTGNKVSRRSQLHGTQHVILGGRTVICADVCIRADLVPSRPPSQDPSKPSKPTVSVAVGRYTYVSNGTLLKPPSKPSRATYTYHPLKIGDHVFIGKNCTVEAAIIESHVWIGDGAVIGKFAILKEGCKILEGTVVPGGMVVPSGAIVGGRPGRVVGELGIGWGVGVGGEEDEGGDLRQLWRSVVG